MLVRLDVKCKCRNNIIAKKCCMRVYSCKFYLQKTRCSLFKTATKGRGMLKIATKELVKMLPKRLGCPN